ncbi:hypothetical protein OSG_eHP18_00180 [environmental Halophage eHP-18]|nr:hypothetical protein OSG_eHP18_00180 [environmental Halophage eHP-18]
MQKKAQERLDEMADSVTAELQDELTDVFDRLDDDLSHDEYVKLVREARQLTTAILDRTGHGPTEGRELENTGDEPLANLTVDFDNVDT